MMEESNFLFEDVQCGSSLPYPLKKHLQGTILYRSLVEALERHMLG